MRKTFNDPLFVSTPQGMVPTPVAENIAGRVGEAPGLRIESYLSNRHDVSRELATGALDLAINAPMGLVHGYDVVQLELPFELPAMD
jgi:hypothetical protein